MKQRNEKIVEIDEYKIAIIGAGGIGSHLASSLIQALHRGSIWRGRLINIRIYDSDRVGMENTAHQRFAYDNIGMHKVEAIAREMGPFLGDHLQLHPCPWDIREKDDMGPADLVVVAVDSDAARRVVHSCGGLWLDLRCKGDGYIALDSRIGSEDLAVLTPDQPSSSCQLEGAIQTGNIQFGHLLAAAHGAQWVLQCMRLLVGEDKALPPPPQAANLTMGTLSRLQLKDESVLEESLPTQPNIHPSEIISECIEFGDHDSKCVRETIAAMASEENWRELWVLANRMEREVSILFDNDDRIYVDIGQQGEVRLAPPIGATIPFKLWVHTHPQDAYWSITDRETLAAYSGILQEALVLGHDHLKHTEHTGSPDVPTLGVGMLGNWTSESTLFFAQAETHTVRGREIGGRMNEANSRQNTN